MKKSLILLLVIITCLSSFKPQTLKGTWKYLGGIYKCKPEEASKEYTLQREYSDAHFNAFLLEPKQQPYKYQSGDYTLTKDSCFETETASAQPSKLTGITVRYHFNITLDTLKLTGMLPNGNNVEEHWLRQHK